MESSELNNIADRALKRLIYDPCQEGYEGVQITDDGSMIEVYNFQTKGVENEEIFNAYMFEGPLRMTQNDFERICDAGRMEAAIEELTKQVRNLEMEVKKLSSKLKRSKGALLEAAKNAKELVSIEDDEMRRNAPTKADFKSDQFYEDRRR